MSFVIIRIVVVSSSYCISTLSIATLILSTCYCIIPKSDRIFFIIIFALLILQPTDKCVKLFIKFVVNS